MPVASSLYYFASEAQDHLRPPAVLIHGAGGSHLYWPPQIRRLHEHRVFALDLSGHGKSDGIGHHSIGEYTDEVVEFVRALGLTGAVLCGHSMGGAIALDMAIRFPRQVLGLYLVGTGAILPVSPQILRSTSDPATFRAAIDLINDLSFASQTSGRLKELAAQRLAETRPSVLHGDFLACSAFDVSQQLSEVAAPTQILCGTEDRMTPPSYSRFLEQHIAGARLEVLPSAGHMVMLEQPEQVAERLSSFLDTVEYRPGA